MINNSALTNTMSVADLVPKAATKLPEARQGDNAFSEALAGAHTVHDRRESQASEGSRRDWAQGDREATRTRGQERSEEVRSDRAGRSDDHGDVQAVDEATHAESPHAERADRPEATGSETDAAADSDPVGDAVAVAVAVDTDVDTDVDVDPSLANDISQSSLAGAATLAVAAVPVATDLDAIIVPTGSNAAPIVGDAIDAALRLAIGTDAATPETVEPMAVPTAGPTTATTTTTETDADVDAALAPALMQGMEDAETGDVKAGPMRPITSTPATTSGPSPAQVHADVQAAVETDAAAAVVTQVARQAVTSGAIEATAAPASGDDVATQLVQATAVATTDDAALDVDAPVADDATVTVRGAKVETAADAGPVDVDVVDADAPEVAQVARLTQQQSPTVAAAAQYQARVQAAAAEGAAEEGSDAAPVDAVEPLPQQASPLATAARGDGIGPARGRDGMQAAGLQERIDHIAAQLATRLRLSQAAGGSHVQLSLKPRELGEVTVQMNVRDGAVAATILVDKPDTLRTMQTNIEELKRSLENQGLVIQEFSVDVRGDSGAGGANARTAAELRSTASRTSTGSTSSVAGAAAVIPGLSGDRVVDADSIHDGDVSVLA